MDNIWINSLAWNEKAIGFYFVNPKTKQAIITLYNSDGELVVCQEIV